MVNSNSLFRSLREASAPKQARLWLDGGLATVLSTCDSGAGRRPVDGALPVEPGATSTEYRPSVRLAAHEHLIDYGARVWLLAARARVTLRERGDHRLVRAGIPGKGRCMARSRDEQELLVSAAERIE